MSVQCAKCGEELMGSVNRCWRCGQEFASASCDGSQPPIRRAPIVASSLNVFLAEVGGVAAEPSTDTIGAVASRTGNSVAKVRKGSPFADRGTAVLEPIAIASSRAGFESQSTSNAENKPSGGAKASAALALPLGVISLVPAFQLPIAGILLATLGVVLSIWGLYSQKRGLAIIGLVICCLSLAIGTFNGSLELYLSYYGILPWQSPPTF